MEDVVLHYKPEQGQDLSALIETTEKLLAPFPSRPPQVFSPWFPSIVDRHLPLRPARPAPTILFAQDLTTAAAGPKWNSNQDHTGPTWRPRQDHNQIGPKESTEWDRGSGSRGQTGPTRRHGPSEDNRGSRHAVLEHEPSKTKTPSSDRGVPFVPETPPVPNFQESDPQVCCTPKTKPASPSKRCWTVFKHRIQPKDQPRVQPLSRRFQQTVSTLQLQSRQRVKWVIDKNNCRDIEQVWRCLSRPPLGLLLPSCCNAHIERSLAQIWVYCDLLQSEQVGLSLKQELKLRGTISLWERRLGTFYSL